mmetsp:Transcript_74287/g.187170  ORF Transcript_74287/g.187170 Transcript_74287/m.187170 type:complete len:152 (+) Transcript_74287:268-723(+)
MPCRFRIAVGVAAALLGVAAAAANETSANASAGGLHGVNLDTCNLKPRYVGCWSQRKPFRPRWDSHVSATAIGIKECFTRCCLHKLPFAGLQCPRLWELWRIPIVVCRCFDQVGANADKCVDSSHGCTGNPVVAGYRAGGAYLAAIYDVRG